MAERQSDDYTVSADPLESLKVLGREKAFIAIFTLSAMATALALTYVASEKYETYTTIFYRPHQVSTVKLTDTQAFGAPMPLPPFKTITTTMQDLLRSDAILDPVVREMKLHLKLEPGGEAPWYVWLYRTAKDLAMDFSSKAWQVMKFGRIIEQDPVQGAVQKLRSNVKLHSQESFVYALIVRDKLPRRAALTVDALGRALVARLLEEDRAPGEEKRNQLGELLDAKRGDILESTRALEKILVENDLASVSDETSESLRRWSELELERVALGGQIQKRQIELADMSQRIDRREKSSGRSAGDTADYLQLEDYKRMASSQTFAEVELGGMQARYRELERATKELRHRLQKLPAIQAEVDRLTIALEGAKRDLILLSDAHQEATIQATGRRSAAKVLHPAPLPEKPVAPIKIYHVGLAGFLGIAVSIGLVYVLEFFNVRKLFKPQQGAAARSAPEPLAAAADR